LPVDWFLDRCRTVINVLGDINVSCMLDGKTREDAGFVGEHAAGSADGAGSSA
jgi:Na+/H+-dicarboxylate symporter